MPRGQKKVKETDLHANAPWDGYINLNLNKQDSERLATMVPQLDALKCVQEMVDQYYKVSFNYDSKRGYRCVALGCMGSRNAGKAIAGYSGSSMDNAVFALYYRLAMMLEWEQYEEVQLGFDFG